LNVTLLKEPKPKGPHCAAKDCQSAKVDIQRGKFFCSVHELTVPRHLRKMLELEVAWLQRKGLQIDEHTVALVTVAANREYAQRLLRDPAEMAKWQAEVATRRSEESAKAAGLILPPKVGELVEATKP
jgi:hypothetical protein